MTLRRGCWKRVEGSPNLGVQYVDRAGQEMLTTLDFALQKFLCRSSRATDFDWFEELPAAKHSVVELTYRIQLTYDEALRFMGIPVDVRELAEARTNLVTNASSERSRPIEKIPDDPEALLTPLAVGQILGLSERTVQDLCATNVMPGTVRAGRKKWRVKAGGLRKYIAENPEELVTRTVAKCSPTTAVKNGALHRKAISEWLK